MKIAIAQLNFIVGNFEYNFDKILKALNRGRNEGADVVVFSELAVCGYPPHDMLEKRVFVETCQIYINKIAQQCINIAAIVGAPSLNTNTSGKALYNSAYFLNEGRVQSVHHKALLPTYDIFDEYRYFEPCYEFSIAEFKGKRLAITICEDLWDETPVSDSLGRSRLYPVSPMDQLAKSNPDVIINIAASPFEYTKGVVKQEIFTSHARKLNIPLLYVNQVGANTDLIFDGGSMIVNSKGKVHEQLKLFDEDLKTFDISQLGYPNKVADATSDPTIPNIYNALVLGIRDYFAKSGLSKATLGLSGGIDSAVVLVLAVEALGAENVRVLLLPSQYSSEHSVTDAVLLAQNLNVQYDIVGIQPAFDCFKTTLKPIFGNMPENIAEENIQARTRGVLLMAISNKFGHILLNTTNKSEMAVGYGTLYGDMNGGLSVLGDVYKTDVYRLARYMNRKVEIIPENIITKAPSAELRPDQKDSDSLPDYDLLDAILYRYIELQKSVSEIVEEGFDKAITEKVARMVNFNEYKRFQTPPVLRISSKAFGLGRKMPLVAKF
jgi:NAD+ synthase (glutamine-hydrolysing)